MISLSINKTRKSFVFQFSLCSLCCCFALLCLATLRKNIRFFVFHTNWKRNERIFYRIGFQCGNAKNIAQNQRAKRKHRNYVKTVLSDAVGLVDDGVEHEKLYYDD